MIKDTTPKTFKEDTQKLVLVKFWAPWCTSCKAMDPIVQQVQEQLESIDVLKFNVNDHPEFALDLGVRSLPTTIIYKHGEPVTDKVIGPKNFGELIELIGPHV